MGRAYGAHFAQRIHGPIGAAGRNAPHLIGGTAQSFVGVSRLPVRFLNHCSYYMDERAVAAISRWMKERVGEELER